MAYTPNIWVDREGTTRYFETVEKDGAKIFTPDYSQLTEIGTPVNADNMNHIEEGIAAGSFTKYDSNTVYQINDLVTSFEGSELKVYKSLKSENYNNPVTDATYWEEVALGGGGSGFNLFDTKVSDHVLEGEEALGWALQGTYVYKEGVAGSRTGYADFYNKCLAEKENSTGTETTLGDNTITMYVNSNGHTFYDIADKGVVDTWYNTYGIADYYGIDTENERIFLPRDKYFAVTGGVAVAGNGKALGLTDGSSDYYLRNGVVGTGNSAVLTPGTSQELGTGSSSVSLSMNYGIGISTDSTKSGIEGQLTPNENKYLYYCVGNTKVESAVSNVTEITTSENDTLPLFYNFYSKEDMTTTGAYVNASLGSWLSGNVYPTAYNELVKKLGTDNVKANTDTYTDYDFVVNQDDMTFRLPIKNGQEIMFATGVKGNGMTLGLTNGVGEGGAIAGSDNNIAISSAYYGQILPTTTASGTYYKGGIGLTSDPTKSGIELDTENITIPDGWNLYYKVANAVTNLELLDVAKVTADLNTKISKTECPAYIVETYQNGTSWYRVYSDGWCEQGGQVSTTKEEDVTITLLKAYNSDIYTVMRTNISTSGSNTSYRQEGITSKTSSSFICHIPNATTPMMWLAKGYIA